ncbi:MAG: 50S ribosomal protein L24 [Gemmatimonadetes bacterium]|nr:50S ribosomal protein L24 [Acidimicrobiia bacterium]MBA3584351.1 50S ribosomal protein L24 [Gemmatimonadota bacterium]
MAGIKIRKGDRVRVLQGKDRGKEGEVTRVIPSAGKVIVDGLNVAKKHQRATRATMQGGIIDREMPIPVSNVALITPDGKTTRIGFRFDDKGNKVRIARRTGEDV